MMSLSSTGLIQTIDDSLFTYPGGQGPLDYHNSSWAPASLSEVLELASQEVKDSCTPEGSTEPLPQCVFDATATGDISVGMATMDTLNENIVAMVESSECYCYT